MRSMRRYAILPVAIALLAFVFVTMGEASPVWHWRPYPTDPSCVLHLPFYKYGAEQTKIWDISGNNNHGTITGAVSVTYPLLSGVDFVSNGEFGSVTTGWIGADSTLASVAGGQSGNCLEITRTGGVSQKAIQDLTNMISPPVNGKTYRFSGWVKSGTSGNEAFRMQDDWWGEFAIAGTSSANWTYCEAFFTHTHGVQFELALYKSTTTAGTMLFDSISIQEVIGYEGIGWGFDGVDDKIDCGDGTSLRLTTSGTILVWVRVPYLPVSGYQIIVAKGDYPGAANDYSISLTTPGRVRFEISSGGALQQRSIAYGTIFFPNRWHLLGLSWDSTTGYPYIDAAAQTTFAKTENPDTAGHNFFVGCVDDNYFWKQVVGEVLIFNRTLSAQEILNYYELTRHRYGMDARDILAEHAEEFEYAMAA
jgi:hypothetical protein